MKSEKVYIFRCYGFFYLRIEYVFIEGYPEFGVFFSGDHIVMRI